MGVYQQKLPSGKVRFFIKGQHNGQAYWQTVESQEAGEQIEAQLREDIQLKRHQPRGLRLSDYIDRDYLPYAKRSKPESYLAESQICARAIKPQLGNLLLNEIDPRTVRAWQLQRVETKTVQNKQRKLSTVNREIAVLSQVFSLAVNDELIERNPCAKVRRFAEEPHRIEYLTHDDEKRLLDACTGERAWLVPVITVALYTGLRPGKSELFALKVENCDFDRDLIILARHKTAKRTGIPRIIPMNSLVRSTLWRFCDGRQGAEYVWARKSNAVPYKRFFKTYKKVAIVARLSDAKSIPYILRHTFGTRLAQAGVSIAEIKDLMGHKDIKMTMRYVHSTIQAKHSAVERLLAPTVAKS